MPTVNTEPRQQKLLNIVTITIAFAFASFSLESISPWLHTVSLFELGEVLPYFRHSLDVANVRGQHLSECRIFVACLPGLVSHVQVCHQMRFK